LRVARALHIANPMRLSTKLALTLLAASSAAHADVTAYRYHARTHDVAAVEPAHAYTAAQAAQLAAAPTPAIGELPVTSHIAPHADRTEPWLSTHDITSTVAPHASAIERCFVAQAPGGSLDLTLVISRDGNLLSLSAAAPSLSPAATHKLEACVRSAVADIEFPARRNDTTAVVPYLFHKTPGSSPILSCWNPKGC
jgi:hypothetical protein